MSPATGRGVRVVRTEAGAHRYGVAIGDRVGHQARGGTGGTPDGPTPGEAAAKPAAPPPPAGTVKPAQARAWFATLPASVQKRVLARAREIIAARRPAAATRATGAKVPDPAP